MSARYIDCVINGQNWRMPVNYAVSKQIAEKVHDPLKLTLRMGVRQWEWTVEHVIDIVFIGVSAAGCSLPRDKVADHVIETGVVDFIEVAAKYVAAMVDGSPAAPIGQADGNAKKNSGRLGQHRLGLLPDCNCLLGHRAAALLANEP